MKSYIVKERPDGSRYFDENTPAGNINPDVVGDGLKYTDGKLSVDDAAFVHKTGDESVEGTKTFVASPVVPTVPDVEDASTKVANTAFVQGAISAKDGDYVHKTGDESIAGAKTFTSSPVVPTVTTGDSSTKAASTAFVAGSVEPIKAQIGDLKVVDGDFTIYVRKTGNDNNDGLTEETALLTMSAAIRKAQLVIVDHTSLITGSITIDVGAGTWTERVVVSSLFSIIGRLTIKGRGETTVFENNLYPAFAAYGYNYVIIDNVLLKCGITGTAAVDVAVGARVNLLNTSIQVGTSAWTAVVTRNASCAILGTGCKISGAAANALVARGTSHIELQGALSINGTFTTVASVADCSYIGSSDGAPATISGTVTGKRYNCARSSSITTGGKGANFFPGSIAGTVDSTSSYV